MADNNNQFRPIDTEYIYRSISKLTTNNTCNVYFFLTKADLAKPKQEKFFTTIWGSDNDRDILKVNLFFSLNHLDLVESLAIGNIIRIQRLNITSVPHGEQLIKTTLSKVDFDHNYRNGNNLNFTVFSSTVNSGYQPILSLNQQYSLTKKDKDIIDRMRMEWSTSLKSLWENYFKDKMLPENSCTSLENLKANQFVSVVAKVLDKQLSISTAKKVTLTLWDGTGDDVTFGGGNGGGSDDTRPLMGNAIQCHTWTEELMKQCEESIDIGDWVYIYGAKTNIYQEILELKLFKTAAIKVIPSDSPQVQSILRNYRFKIKSNFGNSLNSGVDNENENNSEVESDNNNNNDSKRQRINNENEEQNDSEDEEFIFNKDIKVTDTPYPHIPVTTIEDVKLSDKVPNKFKIHVSLVQHIPLNILDFSRIKCKNENCGKTSQYRDEDVNPNLATCLHCDSSDIEFIFLFKLIVKDQTGELPVVFYYNANTFLNIHPTNLYIDKKSLGEIEAKMSFLKKPNVSFDLCLQSYYEEEKDRTPDNIKYQAFDTKLLVKL